MLVKLAPARPARSTPRSAGLLSAVAAALAFAGCAREVFVPTRPPEVRLKAHEEVVLDGSGSFDPEGEKLAYRWRQVAGPVVELRDAATPWPRFTPTGPGRYEFELVVAAPPEGGEGALLEGPPVRLSVDVLPPNRPPRIEPVTAIRAEPGQWATLDGGGATDPDGDVLSFRWERIAGEDGPSARPFAKAVEMDPFDGRARRVRVRSWHAGEYRFRLTVTDAFGAEATAETVLRVVPNDLAPVGVPRVKGGASGTGLDSASGHFALRLGAWPHPKGGVNEPPVAVAREEGPDEDGAFVLNGLSSRDPNGDALGFRWEQTAGPKVRVLRSLGAPDGRDTGAGAKGLARVEFTPPAPGRYAFRLVVSDGVLESDAATVEVVVSNEIVTRNGVAGDAPPAVARPRAPEGLPGPPILDAGTIEADAGEDATVETGTEVVLGGRAGARARRAGLVHDWRQVAGPRVTAFRLDPIEGSARPRFTPQAAGQYEFELRVSRDRVLWSAPDLVRISVVGANRSPWIDAPRSVRARAGEVVRVAASWGDPDGDETSVTWRRARGRRRPVPQDRGVAEFQAPEGGGALEATVRDSRGARARAVVTVVVPGEGRAPVAVARARGDIRPGGRVLLDGTESYDLEGKPLEFSWDLAGTTLVEITGHDRALASFRAPAAGSYEFTLVVRAPGRESSVSRVAVDVPGAGPETGGIILAPVPSRVTVGGKVVLDASATVFDSQRPRITWTRIAGPGDAISGVPVESSRLVVKTDPPGEYRFRVEADAPGLAPREVGFDVVPANDPPVASARATVGRDGRVILDGSGSLDPEGAPLLYRWTEVGGRGLGLDGRMAGDPRLVIENALPGRHAVRLAVTDGERVARSEVVSFLVADLPPGPEGGPR